MLTSKTKVAPLKELSILRLELRAAPVLVKLMSMLKVLLPCSRLSINQSIIYFDMLSLGAKKTRSKYKHVTHSKLWLDSQTALFWIMNRGQ